MKKILYSLLLAGVFAMTGCMGGFLNINDNPNLSSDPTLALLFTGLERTLVYPDNQTNINMAMPAIVNHLSIKELDNYGMTPTTVYMTNTWMFLSVMTIPQADEVITRATEQDCMIYAGMAKLMKAYIYMNMVDLWGDVPYTEAYTPGNYEPVADESSAIYNDLLLLIDEARSNLNDNQSENVMVPGADDVIYGGDVDLWQLFANTLELKLLVQSRKAKDQITNWTGRLNTLLSANQFIGNGQDFQFPHSATRSPVDERHQSYVSEYAGAQKTLFISPWFYEIMMGYNQYNFPDNPMTGIRDPRIPYYFVNQSTPLTVTTNIPDYRDGAFISIVYNSNSGNEGSNQDQFMTCVGIYPVGGLYDAGTAVRIGEGSGTGIAPNKMLQAYSVPFMKAELYLTEGIAGDASAALREGIEKSFTHINSVCQAARGATNVPELVIANNPFISSVVDLFDSATDDMKLEILMTQKWIANFYNSLEAYADIRRTGYPRLMFDVVGGTVLSPYLQQTSPAVGPAEFPLNAKAEFPRIIYYSNTEVASNRNITNVGRNVAAPGNVFWDR